MHPEREVDDAVLLGVSVPRSRVDAVTGSAWLAGATGIAEEHVAHADEVRLLVTCAATDQASVAVALGGDVAEVDSWTPVVRRVSVPFVDSTIELDVPANVFGDGAHPTTATCLELVAELDLDGRHVLDVGCGAGLLSVAAALRGATVTAIDIWGPAVEATSGNAERAGVDDRIVVLERSVTHDDRADVVLANIGAATLVELAGLLRSATDGPIVLSGLLDSQADEVAAAYESRRPVERRSVEGWTTLLCW